MPRKMMSRGLRIYTRRRKKHKVAVQCWCPTDVYRFGLRSMLEKRFMNEISGMLIAIPARFHKASP